MGDYAHQGKPKSKLRFDLIPAKALQEVAKAYTIGADKHGDEDWRNEKDLNVFFAAMQRHAWRWKAGEQFDDDGHHHLSAVVFNAMSILDIILTEHPVLADFTVNRVKSITGDSNNGNRHSECCMVNSCGGTDCPTCNMVKKQTTD